MNKQHSSENALISAVPAGRRSILGLLIGLIWATITGTIGAIAAGFLSAPTTGSMSTLDWVEIGALKDIPEGKPIKREVVVKQDSGWAHISSVRSVWIVRRDQNTAVYSSVCPHLGCTVDASAVGFACPCHGSSWSANGERLGGPTPRGLDMLESRIDGDTLKVRYEIFKQGSSQKEPA